MYNGKQSDFDSSSHNASTASPKSYQLLLKLSRAMGSAATRSYVEVRHLLAKEIVVSPSERFLAGMPRLTLSDPKQRSESKVNRIERLRHPLSSVGRGQEQADQKKERDVREGKAQVDAVANLKKVVAQAHEVLASANTVFPLTLFPDTVFVDRTKITIIRRNFFWSSDVMSIRIEDVLNVSASVGPLFGSLTIASRVMSTTDHFQIDHFWRNDAAHLKHIIQGYVIAQHNNIDTAHLTKDELVETLRELGHDSGV